MGALKNDWSTVASELHKFAIPPLLTDKNTMLKLDILLCVFLVVEGSLVNFFLAKARSSFSNMLHSWQSPCLLKVQAEIAKVDVKCRHVSRQALHFVLNPPLCVSKCTMQNAYAYLRITMCTPSFSMSPVRLLKTKLHRFCQATAFFRQLSILHTRQRQRKRHGQYWQVYRMVCLPRCCKNG